MPELAYLNGKIMPIEEARVPIEDRGYQFADAVYEYFASYKGKLFAVKEHLDRLEKSLRALEFPPISRELLRDAVLGTFQQAGIDRAGVYLQISRGVAPRNHAFPNGAKPQIVITVRQVPDTSREYLEKGIAAITVTDIRWGRCDIKTVQLLPNVLAKQQALSAGVQDAIFVSPEGIVREGTSSNLFIAIGGRLKTHPLTPHILPGITRAVLLDICRKINVHVEEVFFDNNTMLAAEEVFITGTVTEVLSVCRIDGRTIGAGKPGPMAARLRKELEACAGAHL
ncbi:MAG: D-amino acid aminotransferase [Desulfobacterales bacterium]|nr:D-amino acid aminotransferase [Desulfobacterales bacterium]